MLIRKKSGKPVIPFTKVLFGLSFTCSCTCSSAFARRRTIRHRKSPCSLSEGNRFWPTAVAGSCQKEFQLNEFLLHKSSLKLLVTSTL